MNAKILGILVILGILIVVIVLVVGGSSSKDNTTKQEDESQVKEAQTKSPIIKDVSAPQAQSLIQQNWGNQSFKIIDVRTASEYTSGHLENAVNIDYSLTAFSDEVGKLDKNKPYLIYCRSGSRSKKALEIMKELGFNEGYNLIGGITSWEAEGLPIVK